MRICVLWVWLCAYLNCVGWTLSWLHQLNSDGYAISLALGLAIILIWRRKTGAVVFQKILWRKLRRRLRCGFPLFFLILSALAFLGGALYPPTNYDALAYRLPRVLNWLVTGQWHWIHTVFDRLNNRSCGIEWISTPIILLTHSNRLLFLINFVSFLLLPGLVFSVFTQLSVRRHVAWNWMWLVPTGYSFLLQSGSIGNDLFGTVFALAAVDFALRARNSGIPTNFFTSVLAAALMTSAKTNNLPLLLPWFVALLPSLKIIFRHQLATLLVAALAIGASVLPTIYFNLKMTDNWLGTRMTDDAMEYKVIYRTGANAVSLTLQNTVPPIFPLADYWNRLVKGLLPSTLAHKLETLIETPGCWFPLPQMQIEENAGLGFGLTFLFGISLLTVAVHRRKMIATWDFSWPTAVRWASALAFLALLAQSNVSAIGRLSAAYYIIPLTLFLAVVGHETVVRCRWWRRLAGLVFVMATGLLVISPSRPLFPRDSFLKKIHTLETTQPLIVRIEDVYSIYRDRANAFAPALAALPANCTTLGYIAFDRPETSLWQPFGTRRIIHVCPGDRPADLKTQGIQYILVNPDGFDFFFHCSLAQWLTQMNAVVTQTISLRLRAANTAQDWCLVRLR